jgi:hypothetical protein
MICSVGDATGNYGEHVRIVPCADPSSQVEGGEEEYSDGVENYLE